MQNFLPCFACRAVFHWKITPHRHPYMNYAHYRGICLHYPKAQLNCSLHLLFSSLNSSSSSSCFFLGGRVGRRELSKHTPLQRSCMSKRSRCGVVRMCLDLSRLRRSCGSKRSHSGALRMCLELGEPSAEIERVETLSLWRVSKRSRWSRWSAFARSDINFATSDDVVGRAALLAGRVQICARGKP